MCVGMTNCFRRFTPGIALCFLLLFHWEAVAQTAFTYQGSLVANGLPADGTFDLRFTLWTSRTGGTQASTNVLATPATGLEVKKSLFTVILDFGTDALNGERRWLQVAARKYVKPGQKTNQFVTVSPRQELAVVPYAVFATTAKNFTGGLAGDVMGRAGATVVASVGGQTAANVAAGAAAANVATPANTGGTIVKRDAAGNFSAGGITAASFTGNGAGLTNLPPAALSGVLTAAQIPALDAAKITSGTLGVAQIPNLDAGKITTGILDANRIPGLDGSKLTTGTVADARLSANVALLNGPNAFTGTNRFASVTVATNPNNQFAGNFGGAFTGNGAGLSNVPVASLSGVLTSNQLPANVAYRDTNSPSGFTAPAGLTVVSSDPQDPGLLTNGFAYFTSVAAPAWRNGTSTDVPTARSGHSAVWTGQELVVWGGTPGSGTYLRSGGRYRPDLDTWQAVSTVSPPSSRAAHTAVWTGSEMIVWGGFSGLFYKNDGGRFSVASQQWSAVTQTGAPAARDSHVAVWTGACMLVWGGRNFDGNLGDGALYNPTNDQWTALTLPNAPAPRAAASGVWAGDRLLVWGGDGNAGFLNTGGQLPFTNGVPSRWLTNSLVGAPSARSGHRAVWTGSRLLVWGGIGPGGLLGDGAAYNPLTDTWTPLASTNAPIPRMSHNAVWTGAEMVVYGGETAGGTTATGGAYDPLMDKWRVLGNPGAPQARSEAMAAWTGSEIIFFGGLNNVSPLSALQRLMPQPTWYLFRKL